MKPVKKDATYADLCEVPEHFVAEMFDGELYATRRPARQHAPPCLPRSAASAVHRRAVTVAPTQGSRRKGSARPHLQGLFSTFDTPLMLPIVNYRSETIEGRGARRAS